MDESAGLTRGALLSSTLAGAALSALPMPIANAATASNGFLATAVCRAPDANAIRFTVGHSQVQDHRPEFGNEWGVARPPVGELPLTTVGAVIETPLSGAQSVHDMGSPTSSPWTTATSTARAAPTRRPDCRRPGP